MDENTKLIVASNLTAAFYSGAERRPSYVGPERRKLDKGADKQGRNMRDATLTPHEVFSVFSDLLQSLKSIGTVLDDKR
jgi:hypothetical protein